MIGVDNEQLGILSFEEAISRAEAAGEDLVEMAATATPPVCRIMDYGKFLYEQSKKQRDARRKQHQHRVKEIKFHPNIDDHDYQTKLNHAVDFLNGGDKVKVSVFFRGREMAHTELGRSLIRKMVEDTQSVAVVESPPQQTGRMILMLLAPKVAK